MKYVFMLLIGMGLGSATAFCQESQPRSTRIDGYHEFNYGQVDEGVEQWTQAIRVLEPKLRSEIRRDVTVSLQASGMTAATALCWQQSEPPNRWGADVNLMPDGIALDTDGNGSFIFQAEESPHGRVNVRIYAHNGKDRKDIFELQLFNLGGVVWQQGIPDHKGKGESKPSRLFPSLVTSGDRKTRTSRTKMVSMIEPFETEQTEETETSSLLSRLRVRQPFCGAGT